MNNRLFLMQKKITNNIIEVLKSYNVEEKDYVNYLENKTELNRRRIKKILDINAKKRISLKELINIANGLGVHITVLVKDIV